MGSNVLTTPAPDGTKRDAPRQAPRWLRAAGIRARSWLGLPREQPGSPFAAARRRLVVTNVIAVCLILALLSSVVYFSNAQTATQQMDAQLQHAATTGAQSVLEDHFTPPSSDDDHHDQQALVPYSPNTPDIFSVVVDAQGKLVTDFDHVQTLGLPAVSFADAVLHGEQPTAATTITAGGHTYRLYAATVLDHGQKAGVVVAGMSMYLADQQQEALLRALAVIYIVVLVLTVLTSLVLTERALGPARLAFARQRQFATAASHELKTPLAVMRSEVELVGGLVSDSLALLGGGPAALAEARQHLEEARSETDAATTEVDFMARLVQDLLLLARDASDKLAHSWTVVDVRALTDDVVSRMRPIAESDDLTLRVADATAGDGDALWVRGDAALLRQLLYGLLENAARYTPSGGSIIVTVREEGRGHLLGDLRRRAVVEVRDTGIGIAPQHLGSIFEPFYRAVSTTRPLHGEQHGTGLGLAMAQWIVHAHGGTIGVRSELGKGSTFTIELPRAHPDDIPTPIERRQDAPEERAANY